MPRTALKVAPGIYSDDTIHAAAGRWADGSNVRFRLGQPQTIGGWESLTASLLGGVCRWAFPWGTGDGQLHFAFGTHRSLEVWTGGGLYDITPALAKAPQALAANPFSVTNTATLVTVTDPGHGLTTGDSIVVAGSAVVGGIAPNGTFTVTVVNANSYTYNVGSPATSTAVGGGSAVIVTPQAAFAVGQIDGTGQAGYGTGPYGAGGYATPSVNDYFPRTWSGGAKGENLIASPRLGTIYQWLPADTSVHAAGLQNAPDKVTFCLVSSQGFVFALGCNEEITGTFNALCVRHTDITDPTIWATSTTATSRQYFLEGGGRIVGGRMIGEYLLIWTNASLFLGTYVGQFTTVWRFDKIGDHCGLIGPGGAVIIGRQAFWISPDRQFWSYGLGGEPQPMACPIREDFADNLAAAQADKIVGSSVGEFGEVRWDYPDARDGYENSRYLAVPVNGPDAGSWYRGQMGRTAMADAGPADHPLGVTYGGAMYWHERGQSADGAVLAWFIESADQFLSEDSSLLVRTIWPDVQAQIGPTTLTLTSRFKPQGVETVKTYMVSPGQDKVDIRASGRLFRMKFSGSASPTNFRLGRPVLDMVATGTR